MGQLAKRANLNSHHQHVGKFYLLKSSLTVNASQQIDGCVFLGNILYPLSFLLFILAFDKCIMRHASCQGDFILDSCLSLPCSYILVCSDTFYLTELCLTCRFMQNLICWMTCCFFLKKAYKYKYNSDYVLYSGSHFDNISANMFTPHSLI